MIALVCFVLAVLSSAARRDARFDPVKRAIMLLGIDWQCSAKRALLWGLGAADASFWVLPRRVICLGGAEVVRRMASRKPHEDPMTRTKSKPKTAARPRSATTAKPASRRWAKAVAALTAAAPKARAGTKHAEIIAMLQDRAGATIGAIMAATGWQQHSVRGFLAGVVRKKLGLNLVSAVGESGRVYRIKAGKALAIAGAVTKQAA
jgi:hypothetical protein